MKKVIGILVSLFIFQAAHAEYFDWAMITHIRDVKTKSDVDTYVLNALVRDEDLMSLFNDSERDYDKYQIKLNQFLAQARIRGIKDMAVYFMLRDYIRGHKLYANYEVFKINVEEFNKKFQAYEMCNLREYKTSNKFLAISDFERKYQENTNCKLETGYAGDSPIGSIVATIGTDLMEKGYPYQKSDDVYSVYKNWKTRQKAVMMEMERQKELGKAMALGAQQYNSNFSIRGDIAPHRVLDFYNEEVAFVKQVQSKKILDKEILEAMAKRPNMGLVTDSFGATKSYDLSAFELNKFDSQFANNIMNSFQTDMKLVFSKGIVDVINAKAGSVTTVEPLKKIVKYINMANDLAIKYPTIEELTIQREIEVKKAIERQQELAKQGKKDLSPIMYRKIYEMAAKIQERKLINNSEVANAISKAMEASFDAVNSTKGKVEELNIKENLHTPMSVHVVNVFNTTMKQNLVSEDELLKAHFVDVLDFYNWVVTIFVSQVVEGKSSIVSTGDILGLDKAQKKIEQYLQNVAYQQGLNTLMQKLAADQYSLMRIIPDPEKGPMTREDFMLLLTGK
jgi:hypothetical protein